MLVVDCTLFFFNDTATTEIYTLSLHDALPIWDPDRRRAELVGSHAARRRRGAGAPPGAVGDRDGPRGLPAGVAAAFGRRRDLGGAVITPDLEGDVHLTVQRREVEHTLQRDGIALVYDAEARDVVAGVHRVGHLHRERDLGLVFSSRRRHTSCSRDWSSDVCSSD